MRTANIKIHDKAVEAAAKRIVEGQGTTADLQSFIDYMRTPQGATDARSFTSSLTVGIASRDVVRVGSHGASELCGLMIQADADDLAQRLAGPTSSPSVQALAALAASMYVRLLSVVNRYDAALRADNTAALALWDKAVNAASMRYVKALDTLARVQRYEVMMTETQSADGDLSRSVRIKSS